MTGHHLFLVIRRSRYWFRCQHRRVPQRLVIEGDVLGGQVFPQVGDGAGPGMSRTLGASRNSHWSATCAGVIPSRVAVRVTTGLVNTGLSRPRGQPSGQNGTNAMPRLRHSARTGVPLRSARWNRFCTPNDVGARHGVP